MRKSIIVLLCVSSFLLGIIPGYFIFTNDCVESDGQVIITSLHDGEVVHSKKWVDASFPEGTYKKEIRINGKKISDVTPFEWNNIEEKAGKHVIEVFGWYKNKKDEYQETNSTIEVIIPFNETYSGDRENFTEDEVIHEGQDILWANGIYNLSTSQVLNGGDPYDHVKHSIDVFGNLTVFNSTICGAFIINVKKQGRLTLVNSTVTDTMHVSGNAVLNCTWSVLGGVTLYMNSAGYFHPLSGLIVTKDSAKIYTT